MRALSVAVIAMAMTAGCIGAAETPDGAPGGQIDGAALNHILIPYDDVVVRLPDIGRETRTTTLGGFSFFNVPAGFYVVELTLPSGAADREIVQVHAGEITRLILQIMPKAVDEPHVTLRSDVEMVQMAMPGQVCDECAWRTSVSEGRPAAVELLVEWDARHPAYADWRTDLIVQLQDHEGRAIADALTRADVIHAGGLQVLHILVPASAMDADIAGLKVAFTFDPANPAPHPDFQVDSRLCLHYIQQETATACSI